MRSYSNPAKDVVLGGQSPLSMEILLLDPLPLTGFSLTRNLFFDIDDAALRTQTWDRRLSSNVRRTAFFSSRPTNRLIVFGMS
jgi:hypothetical protein